MFGNLSSITNGSGREEESEVKWVHPIITETE